MGTPMYDHSWKLQAAVEENNEPPVVHDRRSFIASICMASAATSLSFPRLVAADDTMDSAVNDKKDDDDDDDGSKYNADTLELFGQDKLSKGITLVDLSDEDKASLEIGCGTFCGANAAGRTILCQRQQWYRYTKIDNIVRAMYFNL